LGTLQFKLKVTKDNFTCIQRTDRKLLKREQNRVSHINFSMYRLLTCCGCCEWRQWHRSL